MDTNSQQTKLLVSTSAIYGTLMQTLITLYNNPIQFKDEAKVLGLIFDRKLNFIPHMKYIRTKCTPKMNILKITSHHSSANPNNPTTIDAKKAYNIITKQINPSLPFGSRAKALTEKANIDLSNIAAITPCNPEGCDT